MTGIYKITNLINDHCYIGQAVDIKRRWSEHRSVAFNSSKNQYNYAIYRAIRKYGLDNFSFDVIEECEENQLNEKEKYWIEFYNSYKNGYNETKGGDFSSNHWDKTVNQYDLNGSFINSFYSIRKASRETGIDDSLIGRCCRHEIVHAGRFLWAYDGEEPKIPKEKPKTGKRKVGQYDYITNTLIATFDSIKEATIAVNGKSATNISNVCNHIKNQQVAYGYHWEFLD